MKKLAFAILLLALSACSKNAAVVPSAVSVVNYHFIGNKDATYSVRFTGSDGIPDTSTITGTEWRQTITAKQASSFKNAVFFISLTSPNTVITGTADITVNNKVMSQVPIKFDSSQGATDLTFYAYVFK